jgi:hypothetical protein
MEDCPLLDTILDKHLVSEKGAAIAAPSDVRSREDAHTVMGATRHRKLPISTLFMLC